MNRETVIALAREAGLKKEDYWVWHIDPLERFAALAYERGFVDGMSEQAKRSVDKAVNSMAQTTHWEGCEAVHPECKTEHGVKDLSNYEFKTYKTGGAELEAGFYSTDELRDLVKALDKMNAATERSMRRMK